MLRNYFLVTLRNMVRNKLFTLINILGISVSLACCILLFSYATRELGYDRQNENVYRLTTEISQKDGQVFKLGSSSVPIAPSMQQEIPEVVLAVRAANTDFFGYENLIKYENNSWYIRDAYFVDSSFFGVLKYKIIRGSADRPFTNNSSAVIEKEWADKIFGQADPLGKIVRVMTAFGPADLEISAVYDKSAENSHLTPSMMVPMSNTVCNSFFNKEQTNWIGENMVFSYARLSQGADPKAAERKLNNLIKKRGGDEMKLMGVSKIMKFQAATSIHTDNEVYMANIPGVVSGTVIRVLILIGIMILTLACVNYINLSTAQAGNRALEVGVRKVMGVTPRGLFIQFLGESFLLVFISLLVSVMIARLALPAFNQLIDKPLSFTPAFYKTLGEFLALFLLVTGLAAGFYPAIYLASFRPAMVLKGRSRDRVGTSFLRKGLVVFQFVISIALISSILIITNQVKFIKNKELGFNKNSKLVITMGTDDAIKQYEALK